MAREDEMNRYTTPDPPGYELQNHIQHHEHSRPETPESHHEGHTQQTRPSRLPQSIALRWILSTLPLLASLAPIAVLAALSPHFSRRLGYNACSPTGEFLLPYTSSIWDPSNFFTITLPFTAPAGNTCTFSNGETAEIACGGYTFTQVKVIDLAWDVLVGRGGQVVLVAWAYRVFGDVLRTLMARGEVGYDLFSAVAFHSGGISSIGTLLRHAVGKTPIPRTRHAVRVYWAIAAATGYIVAMPTLFSAMTGYTSTYVPFVNMNIDFDSNLTLSGSLIDCGNSFAPVWGKLASDERLGYGYTTTGYFPIVYDHPDYGAYATDPGWIDYYNRYESSIYSQCPQKLNISTCPAAQIPTHAILDPFPSAPSFSRFRKEIPSPAPGIIPFPPNAPRASQTTPYNHWACSDTLLATADLSNIPDVSAQTATGICRARKGFAWGFSFLFVFVVAILNFVFACVMYGLWIDEYRGRKRLALRREGRGEFKDAVTMVEAAQRVFGGELDSWGARALKERVVGGYVGLGVVREGEGEGLVGRRKRWEAEYGRR